VDGWQIQKKVGKSVSNYIETSQDEEVWTCDDDCGGIVHTVFENEHGAQIKCAKCGWTAFVEAHSIAAIMYAYRATKNDPDGDIDKAPKEWGEV
jgi:hypothetical protein